MRLLVRKIWHDGKVIVSFRFHEWPVPRAASMDDMIQCFQTSIRRKGRDRGQRTSNVQRLRQQSLRQQRQDDLT